MERGTGIVRKYSREISRIENKLAQLEKGNIYELTGAKMDGSLPTNISKLRDEFHELLVKIETNSISDGERLREGMKKAHD
ncbi:hypothetical protein ABWW12_02195 [Bacillus subtilis]|uniref:hypothetical protein n=1 Tax=Bacillus TaxID=1386 RepID=UPI000C227A5D|nr:MULTISPECIES: hypothetical protein [Bacillus]MCY7751661.1 hypothetical protein [Bacillus inaquosorum]MCY9083733.1 hypothetical protein [Bacillus inaquosorum]PJH94853.1 hypothetical protein CVV77_06530 [Bacillus sp. SN1]PSI05808.1 hypothetical protein C7H81_02165 [Bacillus subtilis]QGI00246.1 hypothetical protein GII77_07150 [Bacillus subtilis]